MLNYDHVRILLESDVELDQESMVLLIIMLGTWPLSEYFTRQEGEDESEWNARLERLEARAWGAVKASKWYRENRRPTPVDSRIAHLVGDFRSWVDRKEADFYELSSLH